MAILSKLVRPVLQNVKHAIRLRRPVQYSSALFSTFPTLSSKPHGLSEGVGIKVFPFDYANMPVVEIMEVVVLKKLEEYSMLLPTPISIEEFCAMGKGRKVPEEESYTHLKYEVPIRLAHMIMELQHLPKELHQQEKCFNTIRLYCQSFKQIIEFEDREPNEKVLEEFTELLKTFKARHAHTVNDMALACMMMRENMGIPLDEMNCRLLHPMCTTIKTFLDRLYTSRISIHMITNQHLSVYGYERSPPHQIGVIQPNTSITSILVDACDDASMHTENCYTVAPKVNVKNYNSTTSCTTEPASGVLIPSHLYIIFYEVMKNAMRATVETHWERKDNLPPITALVCQADDDFTIKISDQGGGVDRATMDRMFLYLYSTNPKYSEEDRCLGYGLPLARLYARYFSGDLRVASYDGFGTDVYIYTRALARTAVERLPVYNKQSAEARAAANQMYDWSSRYGTGMMQALDKIVTDGPPVLATEGSIGDVSTATIGIQK